MRRNHPGKAVPRGRTPLVVVAAVLLVAAAVVYWPRSTVSGLPPPLRIEEMAGLDDAALVERVASDLRWRMVRIDADPSGWRGAAVPVRSIFVLAIGGRMLSHFGLRAYLEESAANPDAPSLADMESAAREIPLPTLASALAAAQRLAAGGMLAQRAGADAEKAVCQSISASDTCRSQAEYIRRHAAAIYPDR